MIVSLFSQGNIWAQQKNYSLAELQEICTSYQELKSYQIDTTFSNYYITGDFFNDHIEDIALLMSHKKEGTYLVFVNYNGKKNPIVFLNETNTDDSFKSIHFYWAEIFQSVAAGEVLWSNWDHMNDTFIDFEDITEDQKLKLDYNAIYGHMAESCGGAYIYWKDGKFHWLQQE